MKVHEDGRSHCEVSNLLIDLAQRVLYRLSANSLSPLCDGRSSWSMRITRRELVWGTSPHAILTPTTLHRFRGLDGEKAYSLR